MATFAQTFEALRGSIKKWQKTINKTGFDAAARNCPLCQLFINSGCNGCPVRERTGKSLCRDTPYDTWTAMKFSAYPRRVENKKHLLVARQELEFLRSLLSGKAPK